MPGGEAPLAVLVRQLLHGRTLMRTVVWWRCAQLRAVRGQSVGSLDGTRPGRASTQITVRYYRRIKVDCLPQGHADWAR